MTCVVCDVQDKSYTFIHKLIFDFSLTGIYVLDEM